MTYDSPHYGILQGAVIAVHLCSSCLSLLPPQPTVFSSLVAAANGVNPEFARRKMEILTALRSLLVILGTLNEDGSLLCFPEAEAEAEVEVEARRQRQMNPVEEDVYDHDMDTDTIRTAGLGLGFRNSSASNNPSNESSNNTTGNSTSTTISSNTSDSKASALRMKLVDGPDSKRTLFLQILKEIVSIV